jgi:hypothetical protein
LKGHGSSGKAFTHSDAANYVIIQKYYDEMALSVIFIFFSTKTASMAIKMLSRRSNGLIHLSSSQKKKRLPSFRRFRQQKPEPAQVQEERCPSTNESARTCIPKRACDAAENDSFDDFDVVSVFDQIDAFVGSFIKSRSSVSKMNTSIKVKPNGSASIASSRRSNQSSKKSSSQTINAVAPREHAACNIFQCFDFGEMIETFMTKIVTQELSHIRVWENIEVLDDDSDNMSALTDISASLATDLIVLPKTKGLYADNTRARGTSRRVMDLSVRDDQSYISFGTIDSGDDIAVDALVRDDISLSFVGQLEEC